MAATRAIAQLVVDDMGMTMPHDIVAMWIAGFVSGVDAHKRFPEWTEAYYNSAAEAIPDDTRWQRGLAHIVRTYRLGGSHDKTNEAGREEGGQAHTGTTQGDGPQGHTRDYTREAVEQEVRAAEGDPREEADRFFPTGESREQDDPGDYQEDDDRS